MLPDVVTEALALVRDDRPLKNKLPQWSVAIVSILEKLRPKDGVTVENVEQLRVLVMYVTEKYLAEAFRFAEELIATSPERQEDIEFVAGAIVAELRARGWSDEALLEFITRSDPLGEKGTLLRQPEKFVCLVAVVLNNVQLKLPDDIAGCELLDRLPADVVVRGRPMKETPYVRVSIQAMDATSAAQLAHRRVAAMLGAAMVFLPGSGIGVASDVVGVLVENSLQTIEVQDRLPEEKRRASAEDITRIVRSSWLAGESTESNPLHDAIRLRHRAMLAADTESRLLLLWSGVERLTSGARGYAGALSAARDLVSKAVTFGKLRRDVGDATAVLEHSSANDAQRREAILSIVGVSKGDARHFDRGKVLDILLGSESDLKRLTGIFFEEEPLLAWRLYSMWRDFGGGDARARGKAIADYHRKSQQRVAWQVERIYRARNRIAHVGVGPERMRDLMWHAHFYLTQLVAICVHYSEASPPGPAQEVLVQRAGQYDAFVRLLEGNEPRLTDATGLMRPASVIAASRI